MNSTMQNTNREENRFDMYEYWMRRYNEEIDLAKRYERCPEDMQKAQGAREARANAEYYYKCAEEAKAEAEAEAKAQEEAEAKAKEEQILKEKSRNSRIAREESSRWVIEEMFKVIPSDKLKTFDGAIYRNSILTSGYFLPHGNLEVYKEGWYVTFEGCRSKFSYWCFDNDGEFVPARKPNKDKLNYLWGWSWYNEERMCEMAWKATQA